MIELSTISSVVTQFMLPRNYNIDLYFNIYAIILNIVKLKHHVKEFSLNNSYFLKNIYN